MKYAKMLLNDGKFVKISNTKVKSWKLKQEGGVLRHFFES